MTSIRLMLFGSPRFTRDGQPVDLSTAKAIALLAYLALTATPQPRERLLALLWPESSAEAGRKNLRNTLWALRRAFGDALLAASDDRIALSDSTWVDVRAFEQHAAAATPTRDWTAAQDQSLRSDLDAATELYTGPLLDGIAPTDTAEFEFWLAAARERLEQMALRVLAALVELHRTAARWPELAVAARHALDIDNLQEPMHRALMEAYARQGERASALRQYDTFRQILAHELGVEPLPATEALRVAIMAGELQPPAAPPRPPRRQPMLGDQPRTPFVGRQRERAVLAAALEAISTTPAQARVVLLAGEMGIGKSRLWHEWAASLPPSLDVLAGRCLAATQALPFMPLIEIFGSPACLQRLLAAEPPIAPIWLAEAARLLPALHTLCPELPTPTVLPPEEERRHIFEALVQCLRVLAAPALVFFLDDAHWADTATLDWLGYLLHRMADQPLLLALAYRPEDAPPALARLIADWSRAGIVQRLALERLNNAEAMALVRALGGTPDLATRSQAQGLGNPLFLIELCRGGAADVPPALAELIRARLERLPETARQVLQAAAILEPDFDLITLRRSSGRGEEEVLDALDALLAAGVLVEQGPQFAFAHPLVAAVVRDGLSGARRAFLHRRAAEARIVAHAGQLAPIAGQLAHHYAEAGERERAAHYATVAAEQALRLAAPAEAVAFYRQAISWEPSAARQMGLGRALLWQGDLAGARASFEAALQSSLAQDDRRGAAQACLILADTYLPAGQPAEVLHWAERGLTYLSADANPEDQAFAHFLLGAGRIAMGRALAEAEADLEAAAQLAATHQLPALAARSRFELGNALAQRGDLAAARRAFAESLSLAQAAGDQFQAALSHNNAAYHALLAGDLPAAHADVAAGLALAESYSLRVPLQYLYSTRGEIALAEAQWDEAASWFARGLAEAEGNHNLVQVANYQANLGLLAHGRGDLIQAIALLESARTALDTLTAPHLRIQVDLWLAEVYAAHNERTAAVATFNRAVEQLADSERGLLQQHATRLRGVLGIS